jgi:23S rRNA (guanosine2251-2'-O)-methyltransferase
MIGTHWIYGVHAVRHTLTQIPQDAIELWVQTGERSTAVAEILKLAGALKLPIHRATRQDLDLHAEHGRHQGILLRCQERVPLGEADLKSIIETAGKTALVLVLDSVQDPQNLGACLRVADAAGVNAVVVPVHRGVGLTAVARKVASGAAESMPLIAVNNLARTLQHLKDWGVWLVGMSDDATEPLYSLDLTGPTAVVLGGEGPGLRRLTREHCDYLARIPMLGRVESLNVATAAGVVLYEAQRQRHFAKARP